MPDDQNTDPRGDAATHDQLRSLVHDIKNSLYVINMGVEALKTLGGDQPHLAEILTLIQRDGSDPLNHAVTKFLDLTSKKRAGG